MEKSLKIEVLDNGFVDYIDHLGSDLTVVNSARVSFNNHKEEFDNKDKKLIKYLAEHNHWTPFGHPQITLRIKAPISIRTQFFKSKIGFVENEISRRYVSIKPEFYKPKWRTKPKGNAKQGSGNFISNTGKINDEYAKAIHSCSLLYDDLIDKGIAPEQARFVLPQGMYTEWYWTGSLAAYSRFYNLRIKKESQWEIQEYAKAISEIIQPLFPVSWEVLTNQK